MFRTLFPVLLVLSLLLPAATVMAGAHRDDGTDEAGGRGPPAEEPTSDGDAPDGETADQEEQADPAASESGQGRGRSDEVRDRDEERQPTTPTTTARGPHANAAGPAIGAFEVHASAREVVGDYVNFSYDGEGIRGYTIRDTLLFNATVSDADVNHLRVDTVARGSMIRVETPAFKLRAHDNPAATTRIDTEGRLQFAFVEGANFTLVNDRLARFTVGNVSGFVRGEDLAVDGTNLSAQEDVLLVVDQPRGNFDKHREAITAAIGQAHVGAEMSLRARDDGDIEHDSVSYGNVTLTTVKAERGNFTFLIDGHGFEGRVLVFNLDGRALGAEREEDLDIRFDNETILQADSIQDVLDPDNDGLKAEYYVVFDPQTQTFQLLVSVPHYSVHVLSVGTLIQQIQPSVVVGVLAGVALLAPAGYVLFRRK